MKFCMTLLLVLVSPLAMAQLLTIDQPTFDFGEINDVGVVTRAVTFTNAGDATLVIDAVKGTCGCTTSKLQKNELAPGESTIVTIKFMPAGLSGLKSKTVRVTSNDKENRLKIITFSATIIPYIQPDPETLVFDVDADGKITNRRQKVTVRNGGPNPIIVKRIERKGMDVELEDAPHALEMAPNDSFEFWVTAPEALPEDASRSWLIVRTQLDRTHSSRNIKMRFDQPK